MSNQEEQTTEEQTPFDRQAEIDRMLKDKTELLKRVSFHKQMLENDLHVLKELNEKQETV